MNESFGTMQKICPQCREAVDTDARFCKYCAFNLANSNAGQNISTEINQTPKNNNTLIISGIIGLLVVGFIGLAIFFNAGKNNQSVVENANSASQSSSSTLTLGEKAQQIEKKILRGESLSASDLEGITTPELRILRNVHFARYGRKYDRPGLGDYFSARPWYKPNDSFNDSMLNSVDKENVKLILFVEKPEVVQSIPSNSSAEEEFENEEKGQPSTLYSEAQKQAETFWKKNLSKCGESYYWEVENRFDWGIISDKLYECKGEPSIFAEGEEFNVRELTEAEKLNGVDPQPEEWKGNATVMFAACRMMGRLRKNNVTPEQEKSQNSSWDRWRDNVSFQMLLRKSKGRWFLTNIPPYKDGSTGVFIKPVQCSNIPRY
jgi:hypothetical protein